MEAEPLISWASFAKQPSRALKKLFLNCPSCCTVSFWRERGYRKEDLPFTSASAWLDFPLFRAPPGATGPSPDPSIPVEVGVPRKCRTVLQIGSLSGRLGRAPRVGLGPKDLDSWAPPRADEATHVGSKHRNNKAAAGRRREELHGGTSAAGCVEAVRPPWLLLGSPTPQQSLGSPCPSASRRGEKPAVP